MFQVPEADEEMGDLEYLSRIANGELATGVLKTFIGIAPGSETIATVPSGKDWYLMGSVFTGLGVANGDTTVNYGSTKIFDQNHGTVGIEVVVQGEIKGIKITDGDTITTTKAVSSDTKTTIEVLEVDVGVSPKL